jgi:hypothetical protein
MYTDILKFDIFWQPFLWPKESRVRILRPSLVRSATKAMYENYVGNRIGGWPVDGRQA